MRIVNMAHGNLYAIGAYVAAWAIGLASSELHVSLLFVLLITGALAAALAGALIEPAFLRPLYRRAEEYQLLMTFGLLLVLEDVMRLLWGPHPLTASALSDVLGSISVLGATYPAYNIFVIVIGALAAVGLGRSCTARASASCCARPRRTCGWHRPSGSTSSACTCKRSPWDASWLDSAAPSSCRSRAPCWAWASMRSFSPSSWS